MKTKEYMELMQNTNLADEIHDLQFNNYHIQEVLYNVERFCVAKYKETEDVSWLECKMIANTL